MQLGISTYTFGWAVGDPGNHCPPKPIDELTLLSRAEQLGVRLVQFGDNLPLHELSVGRLAALKQETGQRGIQLEVGARGLTDEHLSRYIELSVYLKSRLLRFVIDKGAYKPAIDAVIGILKNAVPSLEKMGITLGIENHDRLLAGEFAEIMERVGSLQIGICLDSVNSMGAGEGLADVVNTLAPYTVNLHLKDFGIRRLPHLMGFQIDGRPAGQGMLNIPWLVQQINPYGRCRTAILEQWVVPEPDLTDTITKEAAWAEESITYLKNSELFCF
ncbi:sugar phosphate isomerase/epimerase [Spirosoma sp. KNUC1025]|uniref:sugar phosphate isomerase/epimerase family protein n=1 Tax=Spirosoma sp. KNUC1025 TaxID=2894082 RepID=UPI0038633495|nr:sugar phosphate isomerase/epimerase [Spirosoma sp. KNUC1025]